ncbi:DUF3540 domain-containing protein [Serratia silvae]|uniref:DUF3540 domain-containing protein n=1 Tax=Serratia silvae TaxID=2824122 RepID=A0ABT0KAS4_9GAMM|nr:DUF3540 domain-containing protein [Serratia silvae]MCL1029145.1 DUF3540 domain-containing protein [Serratia silvae]
MTSAITPYTLPTAPPQQAAGQVVNLLNNGTMMVESEGRGWHCRRAASCLMTPELGDRVLIASVDGQFWLLAVLERAESQHPAVLSVEGDLQIAPQGNLSLASEALNITAKTSDCHIDTMSYSGESITAWVSLSRIVGKQCESVWQTVTQISHRLLRKTTQMEQVRAGQLDMQAEDYLRMHAQQTLITSDAITKINSAQIHME